VLSEIKKARKGRRYVSDEDVKAAVVQWFQQQPKELRGSFGWCVNTMLASTPM
jgi:hypothetical protein